MNVSFGLQSGPPLCCHRGPLNLKYLFQLELLSNTNQFMNHYMFFSNRQAAKTAAFFSMQWPHLRAVCSLMWQALTALPFVQNCFANGWVLTFPSRTSREYYFVELWVRIGEISKSCFGHERWQVPFVCLFLCLDFHSKNLGGSIGERFTSAESFSLLHSGCYGNLSLAVSVFLCLHRLGGSNKFPWSPGK